jgi:large subunit ribosomal protein L3
MKFILGKKLGMSQIFDEQKKIVPVTLIEAGPCFVVQLKTKEKDGYQAVQIGFEEIKDKNIKKPQKGHFKKAGLVKGFRYLIEFANSSLKIGGKIDVSMFQEGEIVKVSGVSKGKGFQGVVKRHGFSGFPATHGTKHGLRAPGSIGSSWPERVFKGRKMAGRMGGQRVTASGLKIVRIDKENNLLAVRGAVPGRKGTLLEIITTKEIGVVEKEKEEKLMAELEKEEKEAQEKKGKGKVDEPKKEEEKQLQKDSQGE